MRPLFKILSILLLLGSIPAYSQIIEKSDTLTRSLIRSHRSSRTLTQVSVDLASISQLVSPIGEGDLVKYIQTQPGVSTGLEGSSAYFVRGGNQGNNLIEIDGVRLYASSHLLGIRTSFPQEVVSSATFHSGNFDGGHANMLSSFLQIKTKDGRLDKMEGSFSVTPFILSGQASIPLVKDKLSLMLCTSYSPLGLLYNTASKVSSWNGGSSFPTEIQTSVYDVFAKLHWKTGDRSSISISYFRTHDDYHLAYNNSYHRTDNMAWGDSFLNLCYKTALGEGWSYSGNTAYSVFSNSQHQKRQDYYSREMLAVASTLREIISNGKFEYDSGAPFKHSIGYKVGHVFFSPASYLGDFLSDIPLSSESRHLMASAWYQARWDATDILSAKGMGRINYFNGLFLPEASLGASLIFASGVSVGLSLDRLFQYYHLIEGLPVGWSLDYYIPASRRIRPESAWQGVLEGSFKKGLHAFTLGGYYKLYDNLVYYPRSLRYFDASARNGWEDGLYSGSGRSYGLESNYCFTHPRLSANLSYTLSRTDRYFPLLNGGQRFPAQFDRPHILNIQLDSELYNKEHTEVGLTGFFTFQSGHNESVKSGVYSISYPWGGRTPDLDFYGLLYNYRLPSYIRLDLGTYVHWEKGFCDHRLSLGVYNVLNRHNPSVIFLDNGDRRWKQLSLFPIMPSISYKLTIGRTEGERAKL